MHYIFFKILFFPIFFQTIPLLIQRHWENCPFLNLLKVIEIEVSKFHSEL